MYAVLDSYSFGNHEYYYITVPSNQVTSDRAGNIRQKSEFTFGAVNRFRNASWNGERFYLRPDNLVQTNKEAHVCFEQPVGSNSSQKSTEEILKKN